MGSIVDWAGIPWDPPRVVVCFLRCEAFPQARRMAEARPSTLHIHIYIYTYIYIFMYKNINILHNNLLNIA